MPLSVRSPRAGLHGHHLPASTPEDGSASDTSHSRCKIPKRGGCCASAGGGVGGGRMHGQTDELGGRGSSLLRALHPVKPGGGHREGAWLWTCLPVSKGGQGRPTASFRLHEARGAPYACPPRLPPGPQVSAWIPPPVLTDHLLLTPQRHTLSTPRNPRGGKHHLNSAEDSKSPRDVWTSERGLHLLPNATRPHSGSHAPV